MKHTWAGTITLLFLFLGNPLAAQPSRELRGQIFHIGESGAKISEPDLIVTLVETGATDDTNNQGIFRLPLPPAFQPGDSITIAIDKTGWRIRYPLDGEARVPRDLQRDIVPIELLQVGSKLFWTHDRIEKFIQDFSERSKQVGRREDSAPSLDLGREIKDWASRYGFSAEQAREEINQWIAEVEAAHEDNYQEGLAAFAQQQFDTASHRFRASAEWRIRQLGEARKQQEAVAEKAERLQGEVVRDLRMEGDSHYHADRFQQALTVYEQAYQYTSKDQTPQLWGATLNDIGHAHKELGSRVAAAEGPAHLAAAVQAHRQALLVFTREQMPRDWASTQNGLGNALQEQGKRMAGAGGAELLAQAVQAYQQALLVRTREQMPQEWATTQNSLGVTLARQGMRTGGGEGSQHLAQAVQAYRQALLVRTREQMPEAWASIQNNLGNALGEHGMRTEGEEGAQLLAQAVQAYRQALLVRTREQVPQDWAMLQNNLGNALQEQGTRTAGEEGAQLLVEAVQAYRQALRVFTRDKVPQNWAMLQNNLGNGLQEQGRRMSGQEGAKLLAQAVNAYQQALLVWTPDHFSQWWAETRFNEVSALLALRRYEEAADILSQVLAKFPDHRQAFELLGSTLNDQVSYGYEAVALTRNWLSRHPDKLRARLVLGEQLFASKAFSDCSQELLPLLKEQELDAEGRIVALGYGIAAGLAMDSLEVVRDRVEELVGVVAAQSQDYKTSWTFEGALHSLEEGPELPHEDLLRRLFRALDAPDRDSLLNGLQEVKKASRGAEHSR